MATGGAIFDIGVTGNGKVRRRVVWMEGGEQIEVRGLRDEIRGTMILAEMIAKGFQFYDPRTKIQLFEADLRRRFPGAFKEEGARKSVASAGEQ